MMSHTGQSSNLHKKFNLSLLAITLSTLCNTNAFAQEEVNNSQQDVEVIEVTGVTTGTLLRGTTPVGTNVIGFSKDDIDVIGVSDSNELLAQIPQVSSTFNSRPTMATDIGRGMPMPKLRNIGVSGASTTLVLLNGMRMPGSGIIQTVPNAAAIPPGAISNLEIVLDGGSSIYGSDAIAGVINFITKKDYEGTEISIEGGFGDSFGSSSFNLTSGTSWGSGSGMVSLYHTQNDAVMGKDRDFITADNSAQGGGDFRSRLCSPGNITVDGTSYQMQSLTQGANLCDPNDGISYVPKEDKSTIYLSLEQELSDRVLLNVLTYYSEWSVDITGDATNALTDIGASGTITSSNPYYQPVGNETSQLVEFDMSDIAGAGAKNGSDFDALAFMPELTVELPNDWRLRAAYGYGRANTQGVERGINSGALTTALAGTDTSTALNPYDVTQSNAAVTDNILAYYGTYGDATQSHHQLRMTVDGTAFSVPAGDVMLAVGAEYFKQDYEVAFGGGPVDALNLIETSTSRNVKSAFGEVVVPLMDSEHGVISVTASGRYDKYNDVGDTFNPKLGIDFSPYEDLRLRAQWGTSFQAPSLADTGAAVDTRAIVLPISPWRDDSSPASDFGRGTILLAGGSDGLEPEESESYSAGFDWTPEFVDGLKVSMTYYNVDYSSAISLAPFYTPSVYFTTPGYASFYTINPTLEQALDATEGFRIDGAPVESLYENGNTPYMIADARRYNLAATKLSGLDFDISQKWKTNFGSINAGLNGSYTLKRESQPVSGAKSIDELQDGEFGDYNFVAYLGTTVDKFSGTVRVLHSDGWENASAKLDSLTTVNLFGSYNLGGNDYVDETLLTVNVDNALDEDAPYFNDANGFAGGSVLGRVFYVGLKVNL
ncbi:TonB-dependent receptor [Aliiglaciecola sp. LCG003]|uniref:TonB-dependent receptor plug domain-containing protein n=1 Tax=Aliiglaciecola sp. LCG003 TaxID=3053655 RepID=UPI00257346D1|nr:TonB-dependent receptor [Aliiglaciecola sp. LCG003]WJG09684.1 TonB-dependent receptor [Aliiglaciecola sp. LCG003]